MAVRTTLAGIKNRRKVAVKSAQTTTGATRGKKTVPRDEAALLRREAALKRVTLGPAAEEHKPKGHRVPTPVLGRKKAPSQMHIKRKGGPRKRLRIHGG